MNNQDYFVTTSIKINDLIEAKAKEIASQLNIPYIERAGYSLQQLTEKYQGNGMLIVSRNNLTIYVEGQEFFFHPGMAKLRIKSLKNGYNDQMITAMQLKPKDSVLDCTMGLGADALVANYVVGSAGTVTGLEINPLMAYVVAEGIKNYHTDNKALMQAIKGIEVHNANYSEYLKTLATASVDVIYFDPMFRKPLYKSASMSPLRKLAAHDPVDRLSLLEACRVARKRVVLKETAHSKEFARLGFDNIIGGNNSPVAYGVMEVGGETI